MKLTIICLVCALVGMSQGLDLIGRWQSVGVRGTLMCGDKPMPNVYIKLWDEDTLDPDDQMACARSDKDGNFEIKGKTKEITTIDPYLKVYHDCNDKTLFGTVEKPCQRKWKVKIPSKYITSGENPTTFYDNGIINMEAKQAGESRNCEFINDC
uniref:Uncharacterized protein n=1 Tax=Plectus sambesii TaxID=2011161 RepID=A0A914WDC4_9BILA